MRDRCLGNSHSPIGLLNAGSDGLTERPSLSFQASSVGGEGTKTKVIGKSVLPFYVLEIWLTDSVMCLECVTATTEK